MSRRPALLALVALAACFVDIGGGTGNSTSDDGSTTDAATGPAPTTASTTAPQHGDDDGGATVDPTTGPVDPTAATAVTTTTTDPTATSGSPGPVCGDGVVEADEQCDDGNTDDSDACTTGCRIPTCDDGQVDGGESDVDCGGPCPGCLPCGQCALTSDCAAGLGCDSGTCNYVVQIDVQYDFHCSDSGVNFIDVGFEYDGDLRVEAVGGGGYVLYSDPQTFGWFVDCVGIDLSGLRVDQVYPTPDLAFAALDPKVVVVPHAAAAIRCGLYDPDCTDNAGAAGLRLSHACD